ncbi:MAG: D-aminoacyl-tRNA deacylase [Sphaerochaeta sp.]
MKSVIQRVLDASVTVQNELIGKIDKGLLVYLGIQKGDTEEQLAWLCTKIAKLRMFTDEQGKMNLSLKEVGGELLIVSQFTLCANLRKGNRPSYDDAADPEDAQILYEKALLLFEQMGFNVKHGLFGAHMKVSYTNDGPVTMMLEA